jgi:hypothetical protein
MQLALRDISKNHASTLEEPADVLDISEPAAQRLFRAARENFGVEIRQSSLKHSIL